MPKCQECQKEAELQIGQIKGHPGDGFFWLCSDCRIIDEVESEKVCRNFQIHKVGTK